MIVHASHELFTEEDFTEHVKDTILATHVIDFNLKRCKICGKVESALNTICKE